MLDRFRREGASGALHFDPEKLELRLAQPGKTEIIAQYPSLGLAFQSAFDGCIGHFAAATRSGAPFESPGEDNLRTIAATLAAYESVEREAVVKIEAE